MMPQRLLQVLTVIFVLAFVVIISLGALTAGGIIGWIEVVQLVIAPFELLGLALLWAVSLNLQKGAKSTKNQPKEISRHSILFVLGLSSMIIGVGLVLMFVAHDGPNGTSILNIDHNNYADMQIGCMCVGIGVLLLFTRYLINRSHPPRK